MRQEHGMIVLGGLIVAGGLALLMLPDLNGAGWYIAAAGLVAAGFGYWFHVRRGNVPEPPEVEPVLPPPAASSNLCPACGSTSIREMNAVETTAFYGYDRFVLARPRVCISCAQGFEPLPSRAGARLMVGAAGLGILLGLALFAMGPLVLAGIVRKGGLTEHMKYKLVLSVPVLIYVSIWWSRRSFRVLDKYRKLGIDPARTLSR
ncbi:hypothetical protein [Singulisphaera sp. PoT]|uniref:hypothetical protein n=1 Tax=Singulisphaera sp. PoT TaxID=3411797 RepID=UPI003BF605DA